MNAAAHDVEVGGRPPADAPLPRRLQRRRAVRRRPRRPRRGARTGSRGAPRPRRSVVVVTTALLAARHLPDAAGAPSQRHPPARHRGAVITPRLVLLGLLTACTTLGEGAAADWAAIFLHDERNAEESVAAIGYAAFAGAMAVGRFGGTWVLSTDLTRERPARRRACWRRPRCSPWSPSTRRSTGLIAMVGWGLGVALVFPGGDERRRGERRPAGPGHRHRRHDRLRRLPRRPADDRLRRRCRRARRRPVRRVACCCCSSSSSPRRRAAGERREHAGRDELAVPARLTCRVLPQLARLPLRRCVPRSPAARTASPLATAAASSLAIAAVAASAAFDGGRRRRRTSTASRRRPRRQRRRRPRRDDVRAGTAPTTTTAVPTTTEAGPPPRSSQTCRRGGRHREDPPDVAAVCARWRSPPPS